MTITVQKLLRAFAYNGIALPDPGCELSPEQVRDVYSATYPEITTASIEGPEQKGERLGKTPNPWWLYRFQYQQVIHLT